MYSLFGFLCILLPCEMGRGKVSEHHTYVGFDHPHERGSSVHGLFDVNLTIRKGHREIAKFFVILLTFFSYTLASTVNSQSLSLSCLSKTNAEPCSYQSMLLPDDDKGLPILLFNSLFNTYCLQRHFKIYTS